MTTSLQQLQREETISRKNLINNAKEESDKQVTGGEDHDAGQVGATKKSKGIFPTTDVDQLSDSKRKFLRRCKVEPPPLRNWVDSWGNNTRQGSFVWLNVYGNNGGYGVLLRNSSAKPIVAASKRSKNGNSFSQMLMGINAGLILAYKYAHLTPVRVICNLPEISVVVQCRESPCMNNYGICNMCAGYFANFEDYKVSLMPLRKKLIDMELKGHMIFLDSFPTVGNKAAKYIAKGEENNFPKAENNEESSVPVPGDEAPHKIYPGSFSRALKAILWKDAVIGFYGRGDIGE